MKISASLAEEPTYFLLRKLWRFAAGQRHLIVVYFCMFVAANCVILVSPLIFGALVREA